MDTPLPKQTTITWSVTTLRVSDEGLENPQCRDCHAPLAVHQPDVDRPDHLLATCEGCGAWYLIEIGADETEAFMFDLPNVTLVHAAVAARGARSPRQQPPKRLADFQIGWRRAVSWGAPLR